MSDLAAICDGCHHLVAPGAGYLGVRHSEINAHRADLEAWHQRYPGTVIWHVWHFRCDPRPEEDGYQIAVEDIATWNRLTWWTAHLMSKTWLPVTDWAGVLRGVTDNTGCRIVRIPAANAA